MASLLQQLRMDFRIKLGYGAAFLLLLISYSLTWYANQQLITQSKWVSHSNMVITHLESLISYVKDAETGVRGFLIMKDKQYLEPFEQSRPMVDSTFDLLKRETRENTSIQILLYTVKAQIDKKYDILTLTKNFYKNRNFDIRDSIVKPTNYGKLLMDSIRSNISTLKAKETELLTARTSELSSRYIAMNVIIVTSLVLAFIFAFFGFITYMRENIARKTADKKVTEFQEQLQRRIEELDIANKELIQMRSAEKFAATGRMARTIAHEVRNPLTNIDLATSQLRSETGPTDENSLMLFDMIQRNSKRINQLITELLSATRFVDLSRENVSVNELLDEVLELAKDRLELNQIEVSKFYTPDMCDISVDPAKIKIALLNIVVNAAEAMEGTKGVLTIFTKNEDNKCVIEISDNGIGMDATALGKLFEPYYTTKTKGNGLGLTNTENIILNHNGTIEVVSAPGEGTTFIIKFDFVSTTGQS